MTEPAIILLIALPLIAGLAVLILPKSRSSLAAFLATVLNLILAVFLFKKEALIAQPWLGFGMDFILRLYQFSGFIILFTAIFSFLIALYSLSFLKNKDYSRQFYVYLLLSLALTNGAVLADNLVLMLFFWEGLLLTLYAMIAITSKTAFKTATKALVIVGVSDLCLMAGIALTGYLAKTLVISQISLSPGPLAGLAFVLMAIGATSKAGAMPFHTWIPDAAVDAPLPFMAFLPATLEKLLGIYLLARITLDMFKLEANSGLSVFLMTLGVITIILAVMMALVQKDYKRLLSYHAISQVGYMILGIGTCLPAGIVGGLFHMLNHALYKCGLFLTAGAVEKESGTTNLEKLGSLRRHMPITFFCFLVTAASISGVPPLNGFFSKELVYGAALERGKIFYWGALLGSFFTAISFLKLGHAAFLDKPRANVANVKEAPLGMLIPMLTIAGICILFGVCNWLPLNNFIQPVLGRRLGANNFAGWPQESALVIGTILVLAAALLHHFLAAKTKGAGLKATDHIRYAPVFSTLYDWAEKRYFDPYVVGINLIGKISKLLWQIDRGIDWFYDGFISGVTLGASRLIRKAHSGYYAVYVVWTLVGATLVMLVVFK